MIFRKLAAWLAMTALAGPALAGSNLPLITQSGQTRQLPTGTTLATQPSTTGAASLNIPAGTAPSSPANGDCWTTTSGYFCQINGTTVGPYLGANGSSSQGANTFFAAPNGSSGTPTFRTLGVLDLPNFTLSNSSIPLSLGQTGFGIAGNSFSINYAPSGGTNGEAFQVYRTDTWTGGTSGQTTAAQRSYMTAPSGRLTYSWTNVSVMNNNGTSADGAQVNAIYGQSLKNSTGATWAATFETVETANLSNPAAGTLGIEVDIRSNNSDNNNNRVIVDAVGTRPLSGGVPTGAATVVSFGYRLQNGGDSSATFKTGYGFGTGTSLNYGFDCSPATITAVCLRLAEGQNVDFSSVNGRPLSYIAGTSQWRFNNNTTSSAAFNVGANGVLQMKVLLVSQLPACNAGAQGSLAYVADISGAATYAGAVSGGGTTQSTVVCDGSSWKQH